MSFSARSASHRGMGRRLRYVPPEGCLVEVTNRTIQGRYLLRPSDELNQLLIGVLGRATRLYGVELHAFVVLSNHYHLLLTVESAIQLARFMAYFQANLAKEAGRLHGWRGPFWHRRYQHILVSTEEAAQVARLRYILANGCKENLVSSPLDWPGVCSTRALLDGCHLEGIWIDRTRERLAGSQAAKEDPGRFREQEVVTFAPLPCWRQLGASQLRMRIGEIVRQIETESAERHRAERTQPLGVRRILRQDPHARPIKPKWSPAPLFHCASREARNALREAYGFFCSAFREAADRLRAGDPSVSFPDGAFPPPMPFRHPSLVPG